MKVAVVAVKPLSIQDKPDVKGVELVYEAEGQRKTVTSWIPAVVPIAEKWTPGQEVDIEEYDKDGKPRFKLPGSKGGGGFGGVPAWANTEAGAKWKDEQYQASLAVREDGLNRRTALMQAVAVAGIAEGADILQAADDFYAWLKASADPAIQGRSGAAQVNGSAGTSGASPPDSGGGQGKEGESDGEADLTSPLPTTAQASLHSPAAAPDEGASAPVAPAPSSSPQLCAHEWQPAPRPGWVVCSKCRLGEKAEKVKA